MNLNAPEDDGLQKSLYGFERCLKLSPGAAECEHQLGRARELQGLAQLALQHYFAAIRSKPSVIPYYMPPIELCIQYELYDTAAAIIKTGLGQSTNPDNDYYLWISQYRVALGRGDDADMLVALENAYAVAGTRHPDIFFNLGSRYFTSNPPRVLEASALLQKFVEDTCRGTNAAKFKEQCEMSQVLIQRVSPELRTDATLPAVSSPAKPSAPPPLPALPGIPFRPVRKGDAYTVWGAGLHLRQHSNANGTELAITGVIGRTNVMDAPRCALHKPGIADEVDCKAPIPQFWLCDTLDAPESECIAVMGWASNFAQIWGAVMESKKRAPQPYLDEFWGIEIPSPIPQRGAKVTVTGSYGWSFTAASSGAATNPIMGILSYKKLEWLEPPRDNPKLPGMR